MARSSLSGASFVADVTRFVKKAKLAPTLIVRKVLFDLSSNIVRLTPVDEGRAKANWQFGTDSVPTGTLSVGADGGLGDIQQAETGHMHYVVNNLPYIAKLEYGGYPNPPKQGTGKTVSGYSTQAPNGMVRITVIRYKEYLEKAMRAL